MKICITGANGFIGRYLTTELISIYSDVRILTRKGQSVQNAHYVFGDLSQESCPLEDFLRDCDAVFHCAGEIKDLSLMEELHVGGTNRLIKAIEKECVRSKKRIHLIHLSSVGVYGPPIGKPSIERIITEESPINPIGTYEITKAHSDKIVIAASQTNNLFDYTIIRPSNVIGIGMKNNSLRVLGKLIKWRFFLFVGKQKSVATYIHVKDVVRAMLLVVGNPKAIGKIYNLSNDCYFEELVEGIANFLKVKIYNIRLPESIVRKCIKVLNCAVKTPITEERINVLVLRTQYPMTKIKDDLGFIPKEYIPQKISDALVPLNNIKKIKIARIVTVPIVYTHIIDLLCFLDSDQRFELHLICNEGEMLKKLKELLPNSIFHTVEINRDINVIADIKTLFSLVKIFIKCRFDIVHSHTPKAGLLTAIAGFFTIIKTRIHSFTGQVWANSSGFKKWLLVSLDKLIVFLNTNNHVDSYGQKQFLIKNGVGNDEQLNVIHKGSLGGININRFNPLALSQQIKELKNKLFPEFKGKVLVYLGRLNRDKGLEELQVAFFNLKKRYDLKLLLVGPVESIEDGNFEKIINNFRNDSDTKMISFSNEPELYIGCADIFCFPSYREGFGTVALEASSMEKPVVASNIYGLNEAVIDGETGLLFEARNAEDLEEKIDYLLSNPKIAIEMGKKGRERVAKDFSDKKLTEELTKVYLKLI